MKIGIGNDHVAVEYKKEITRYIVLSVLIIQLLVKQLQMQLSVVKWIKELLFVGLV